MNWNLPSENQPVLTHLIERWLSNFQTTTPGMFWLPNLQRYAAGFDLNDGSASPFLERTMMISPAFMRSTILRSLTLPTTGLQCGAGAQCSRKPCVLKLRGDSCMFNNR